MGGLTIGLGATRIKGGAVTILGLDTIVAAANDTSNVLILWDENLTGDFTIQYYVRNVAGNTKVKLYYQESNDSLGWFNTTLIDSCVAGDSALVNFDPNPVQYVRFYADGFGSSGDSSTVKIILKSAVRQSRR